ncbi:hypothetical protein RFI_36840, partial [Reticulomyxa filosa]
MSKEEDKFIEAAEDKETKEDDFASTSAERHNNIEEEYQNALVDSYLETSRHWQIDNKKGQYKNPLEEGNTKDNKERRDNTNDRDTQATEAIGELENTAAAAAAAAKQDKPIEASACGAKQLQKHSNMDHVIIVERPRHAQRLQLFQRGQEMQNHRSDKEGRATAKE